MLLGGEGLRFEQNDAKVVVFVPFVPNPLTGVTVIVDSIDIIPTNLSVEEGMRWVISFGAFPDILKSDST